MARNPQANPYKVLGMVPADIAAMRLAVNNYLVAHDDQQTIPDAALRALHPALGSDQVWNELKKELGL